MTPKAGYATPVLHVRSIESSIRFYEQLGFETVDTDHCDPIGWARLHCEGGAIMLLRGEEPMDPTTQSLLLYMYTPDLKGLRARLLAAGITPSAIRFPDYMPSGEFRVDDPDGHRVLVAHWGEAEHEKWLERIGRSRGQKEDI